ncbi:MAG: hypothetical protein HY914_02855 [Desulfomonile tiedjei]|nr:hypothetical protein [Desulfomonile tiedjei]
MRSRIIKSSFAVLISIVALLAGVAVMAGPVPVTDSCRLITPTGANSGFTVSVVRSSGGDFPFLDGDSYKWQYFTTASGTISSSGIHILVPSCSSPEIGLVPQGGMTISTAGNPGGDVASKTFFAMWTDHDNVVKLSNYNDGTGSFSIRTFENNPIRQTSMQFKLGNNFYFCPGIAGPDCIETPPPILAQAESYTLGQTGCVMQITLLPNGKIADAKVFDPADPTNFNCPASGSSLTIESIGATSICTDANVPETCQPLNFVQKNIMAKSGDHSTFCYYTTTGYRVCKTVTP